MRTGVLLMVILGLGCEVPLESNSTYDENSANRVGNASLFGVYTGVGTSLSSSDSLWNIELESYECGGAVDGVLRFEDTEDSIPLSGTVSGNTLELSTLGGEPSIELIGSFQSHRIVEGIWIHVDGGGGQWSVAFQRYSEEDTPCRFADVLLAD